MPPVIKQPGTDPVRKQAELQNDYTAHNYALIWRQQAGICFTFTPISEHVGYLSDGDLASGGNGQYFGCNQCKHAEYEKEKSVGTIL